VPLINDRIRDQPQTASMTDIKAQSGRYWGHAHSSRNRGPRVACLLARSCFPAASQRVQL